MLSTAISPKCLACDLGLSRLGVTVDYEPDEGSVLPHR